jgi:hypothetical protein
MAQKSEAVSWHAEVIGRMSKRLLSPLKRVMNVHGREIPENPECGESHHLEHAE